MLTPTKMDLGRRSVIPPHSAPERLIHYSADKIVKSSKKGVVRIKQQDGEIAFSESFNIERGVLQGDIFSPVCFIAGLDRIFRLHDQVNPGMTVGTGAYTVRMSKFEYADDAALIDEDAKQATARVTSLAIGSLEDAAMIISAKKSKVMHIHRQTDRQTDRQSYFIRPVK